MAQIPDYTALGPTPVPNPSYRRPFIDESARGVDEAIAGFGQTLERAGDQAHQQDVNFARSQASTSLIDHELAVKTQTEAIREQVASGQLPWDQAPKAFDDWNSKQQTPQIQGLDPMGQELLERGMKRNALGGAVAVQGIANTGKKQAFVDNFDTTLNSLGKLAGMPQADIESINSQIDAYRPQALAAGIPSPVVDKAIQNFKDRNWLNQATQRSMEAKDSMPDLQELQHDLTDADGAYAGKLDTEKRNMVLRTVLNDQSILQNRMDHEADKREAKAQSMIGRIDEQISSGVPLSADMWDTAQRVTQDTSFADDFKQRLKDEQHVQQVLHQPIDQQLAYVQQRAQALDQQGGTLRDRANLNRLQTAVNQNVNLMQKAPLLFGANRNGTEVQPLDMSALNPASPIAAALGSVGAAHTGTEAPDPKAQFQAQIQDRMATLKALRTQYGPTITPSVLLPQEATQLSAQLDSAAPSQRAQMLVSLRGAMNDDQAYQNSMHQIAPHSPVTAIAGSMVGNSAPASTPMWFDQKYAATIKDASLMLSGDSLLNPNKATTGQQEKGELKSTVPMPPDGTNNNPGLRDQFMREAHDLFRDRPQLGEAYFAAFKAADAGLRAGAGDLKGDPNHTIEKQALKIALGNTLDFNGAQVKVPDGMDPTKFKGYVNKAIAAVVKASGGGDDWADRIQGYRLREGDISAGDSGGSVGSGRYTIMDGPIPMTRPDGKGPLTIDLRKQFAPSSAADQPRPAQ
jgi:hypothetical protein